MVTSHRPGYPDELAPTSPDFARLDTEVERGRRWSMVAEVQRAAPSLDARVVDAMLRVPRHLFVPALLRDFAYDDRPLAIGFDQTISQPLVVGLMCDALRIDAMDRILEIGAGSGYHAAVMSLLGREVFGVERVEALAEQARARLSRVGYANVRLAVGDGSGGWPEHAPFDRVLVTAATERIEQTWIDQLNDEGLIVAPVGPAELGEQRLVRGTKRAGKLLTEDLGPVRFVPLLPGVRREPLERATG